jgi:hypothetical protein
MSSPDPVFFDPVFFDPKLFQFGMEFAIILVGLALKSAQNQTN